MSWLAKNIYTKETKKSTKTERKHQRDPGKIEHWPLACICMSD